MSAPTRQAQPLSPLSRETSRIRLSVVPRYRRRRACVHERGREEGPGRCGGSTARARWPGRGSAASRRLPPARRRDPAATGGAVVSAPEASVQSTRPLARSTAARPRPATSARSPSRTAGRVPRDAGLGLPADGAGSGLEAPQRAVVAPHEQDPVGGAQAAGEALGLPRHRPGRRVERAHGPVAGRHVDAAAVAARGAVTKSPSSVFQAAVRGRSGGFGAARFPAQPARRRVARRGARLRDTTAALYTGGAAVPGRPGGGGYNPAFQGAHGERDHPHPRLRLAVHPAHRPPAARAAGLLRDPAAGNAGRLPAPRAARGASSSPAARTASTSAAPPVRPARSSSSACRCWASATACSS